MRLPPSDVATWMSKHAKWKKEMPLRVLFCNKCPWTIDGTPLGHDIILIMAKTAWNIQGKDCFVQVFGDSDSDIRVKFSGKFVLSASCD